MYHTQTQHSTEELQGVLLDVAHYFIHCVCSDISEMNKETVFMLGTVINHHRARDLMHNTYTLALCQNRVFVPILQNDCVVL